jgi:hypothetical protein
MIQHLLPLGVAIVALCFTGCGSWYCNYFKGATISFTSAHYGLWTLQDVSGKCQLWDQLFFAYDMGPLLRTARFFSMAVQLDGLALVAVLSQALQFHACSWGIFFTLLTLFLISIFASGLFNLWTFFFLFNYVLFILIARFLFIHPVHRRISPRGCKIISGNCALCSVFSFLTLIVLRSDFCTCNEISSATLVGRNPGNPCQGTCTMQIAGYLMVFAGVFWGFAAVAVLRYGIQPDEIIVNQRMLRISDHYPRASITTRIATSVEKTTARSKALARKTKEIVTSPFKKNSSSFDDNSNDVVAPQSASDEVGLSGSSEMNDVIPPVDNEGKVKETDTRSRIKKLCCDYRVTLRSRNEQCWFWTFRSILFSLVVMYFFFIVLKLGSFNENWEAALAPDTSYNFILNAVCAFNLSSPFQPFLSFPTKQDAVDNGLVVAHCGNCGACSNPADIRKYVETRKTIAITAKKCGSKAVFGSYEELTACLEEKIGFTPPCTKCWTDNMINTATYCLFTCMKATFTGTATTNNVKGTGNTTVWLNQCIYCDEKMSGPAFVNCSGVARRRLGVVSEIERNPEELCENMDFDWVNVNFTALFPGL